MPIIQIPFNPLQCFQLVGTKIPITRWRRDQFNHVERISISIFATAHKLQMKWRLLLLVTLDSISCSRRYVVGGFVTFPNWRVWCIIIIISSGPLAMLVRIIICCRYSYAALLLSMDVWNLKPHYSVLLQHRPTDRQTVSQSVHPGSAAAEEEWWVGGWMDWCAVCNIANRVHIETFNWCRITLPSPVPH